MFNKTVKTDINIEHQMTLEDVEYNSAQLSISKSLTAPEIMLDNLILILDIFLILKRKMG